MLNTDTAEEEAFTLFLFSKDEKSEKIYKNSPSCFTNKLPKRLFHQNLAHEWVVGVEEFGLDLSAFVNVSTTIDEPAIYLGLFTDRDHGIYSSDIGPSEFFIPTRDTDPTKFYIPHRTIQNFLNGKQLENENKLCEYYLKPRNYHGKELLFNLSNIFKSFNPELEFWFDFNADWNVFRMKNNIPVSLRKKEDQDVLSRGFEPIQDHKMLITLHENLFKILNSNEHFSSHWKRIILDNKQTYYYCFLGEQREIGSSFNLEFFNKDVPSIMQLKCDLIHPYPPYSDNLPIIFERSIQEKDFKNIYYSYTEKNIRYFNLKQTEISSISVQFTSPDGLYLPLSHLAKQSFVKLKFKKSMQFNLPILIMSNNSSFEENTAGSFRVHMNPPLNFTKKHTNVSLSSFTYPNNIHMFPKNMSPYFELDFERNTLDGNTSSVTELIPLPNLCGSEFIHKPELFIEALNKACEDVINEKILIWSFSVSIPSSAPTYIMAASLVANEGITGDILMVRCIKSCVIRFPSTLSHFLGLDFALAGKRKQFRQDTIVTGYQGKEFYQIKLHYTPNANPSIQFDDFYSFHFKPDFSFFYPDSMFICCSLISPVIAGSEMRRLLKIIKPDTDPQKVHQKYFTYEFETHEYFPIENSHYSDFEIQIQYFNGDVINFKNDEGVVRMGMHFIN